MMLYDVQALLQIAVMLSPLSLSKGPNRGGQRAVLLPGLPPRRLAELRAELHGMSCTTTVVMVKTRKTRLAVNVLLFFILFFSIFFIYMYLWYELWYPLNVEAMSIKHNVVL